MRSKAFHALEQKLSYFNDDIELIDVLRRTAENGELTDANSAHVLRNVDPARHAHLARRQNTDGSRRLVMNHLRSTVYSSYVKDVYEEVTHYLKTLLEKASKNGFNSGRLIGEHSFKVDAKTVLGLGSWDKVCELVTSSVFQVLEAEKSTVKLLEKIASKLALNVDRNLITTAIPYLEVRHFLVHADGKVTAEFAAQHPHIVVDADGYVILNYVFITSLRDNVKAMMADYDKEVIANSLLKAEDTMP